MLLSINLACYQIYFVFFVSFLGVLLDLPESANKLQISIANLCQMW